jgi:hypothetical protein
MATRYVQKTVRSAFVSVLLAASIVAPLSAQPAQVPEPTGPALRLPPHAVPGSTLERRSALGKYTPEQRKKLLAPVKAHLQERWKEKLQSLDPGIFRSWQEIVAGPLVSTPELQATSVADPKFRFSNSLSAVVTPPATVREYRGLHTRNDSAGTVFGLQSVDLDIDGLPDDFESQLANNFTPYYGVSSGESKYFARFDDSVPQTVTQLLGPVPPASHFRVQPLGLSTDCSAPGGLDTR